MDAQIQRAIKEILGDTQEISIDSRQEKVEQKARSFFSLQMLGITMSVVLFFIAVLNFMNTIYAGILARDRELAMLECIGMSKKQIKQMLVIEGYLYVFITTFLVLTLGTAIYLLAYQMFTNLLTGHSLNIRWHGGDYGDYYREAEEWPDWDGETWMAGGVYEVL